MGALVQLIIFVIVLGAGYFVGSLREAKHYRSIKEREKKFLTLPVSNLKNIYDKSIEIEKVELVTGCAVISQDYFKRFLAGLINVFGGEMSSYETLIDRARREAVLRMKEMAPEADFILNLRIETSTIGQNDKQGNSVGSIEVLAYGTAVTKKKTFFSMLQPAG